MKDRFHFAVLYASHHLASVGYATLHRYRWARYVVALLVCIRLLARFVGGH